MTALQVKMDRQLQDLIPDRQPPVTVGAPPSAPAVAVSDDLDFKASMKQNMIKNDKPFKQDIGLSPFYFWQFM